MAKLIPLAREKLFSFPQGWPGFWTYPDAGQQMQISESIVVGDLGRA
jgi:hypothetical protein